MPIDRGVIDQQLQDLGEGSRWWNVRELRDLPAVLHADECIRAIARGKIARLRWLRRPWLILVSDQRLLCLRSGGRTSWRQLEVPAGQITRVTLHVGPFRGRVRVTAGGRKYGLLVPRAAAYKVHSALSSLSPPATLAGAGFRPTRMARQVIDHILALPAVALDLDRPKTVSQQAADTSGLQLRLESLEKQVQEMQEHIDFLEKLLRQRHESPPSIELH